MTGRNFLSAGPPGELAATIAATTPRTDYTDTPPSVIAARTPDPERPGPAVTIDGEWQWGTRDQDGNVWDYEHETAARTDAAAYGWALLRRRIGDWQAAPVEVTP